MIKSELRKIYLEKRMQLSVDERGAASLAIADHFFKTFDLVSVGVLHCFIPIARFNEIDTHLIFERLWREYPSVQTVVPRVDSATNELQSLRFERDTALAPNACDIHEPTHDEFVADNLVDMVLVPGVCFDRNCHRVGYGKGFYDRFLKRCRRDCVKIGLSYFDPVEKIEDVHAGDFQVDSIVTPTGVRNVEPGMRDSDQAELM